MSKGRKTSKTVEKMIEQFHSKWEQGLSINEISKIYGVSFHTAYKRLDEIAQINGVTRETYLGRKQSKQNNADAKNEVEHIDSNSCKKLEKDIICEIDESCGKMTYEIRVLKENIKIILEENESYIKNVSTNKEEN